MKSVRGGLIFLVLSVLIHNNSLAQTIIDKPIRFNATRVKLTRQYQLERYGITSRSIDIDPRMIVIHCTNTATLKQAFLTFTPTTLHNQGRSDIAGKGALNVSAQFLVDRDGTVYRLMPETRMARHVIGLNKIAIGIENVACFKKTDDLTPEQLNANAYLVEYLAKKYKSIHYLIGHYEYLIYRHTPLWMDRDPHYCNTKDDPGPNFMRALRNKVKNLGLQPTGTQTKIVSCRSRR